jgi:hypothetical protein
MKNAFGSVFAALAIASPVPETRLSPNPNQMNGYSRFSGASGVVGARPARRAATMALIPTTMESPTVWTTVNVGYAKSDCPSRTNVPMLVDSSHNKKDI